MEFDIFGRDVGHQAVIVLGIGHVAADFVEQRRDIEIVEKRIPHEMILLKPAEFFAVRAVGEDAHHVAAHGPVDERIGARKEDVGRGELPHRG